MADEKEKVTVEAEEVNDFQEFKEKIREKFTKRKQTKWRVAKNKIIAITPIVALATFLLIGFLTDTWHPTWLVFLACPFVPLFLSLFDGGRKEKIVGFVSLTISVAYVAVGFLTGYWHPTWVAFFLIPITGILIGNDRN